MIDLVMSEYEALTDYRVLRDGRGIAAFTATAKGVTVLVDKNPLQLDPTEAVVFKDYMHQASLRARNYQLAAT